jgi:hypothetical protein
MDDFIEELGKYTESKLKNVVKVADNSGLKIFNIEVLIEVSEEFLSKWGLDKDITFHLRNNKCIYLYKNVEVNPDCYWLKPVDINKISTHAILKECIKQSTFRPKIKHLEVKEDDK